MGLQRGNYCNKMTTDSEENVDNHHPPSDDEIDMLKSDELEAILNQLNRDGELEAMLSQERMRAEKHRNNYAKIKEEYAKLVHENRLLASEISRMDGTCKAARSTALAVKQQSDADICRINEEVKMLEIQVPSAAELLDMENKISASLEEKWRHKMEETITELETAKMSVQNLLADNLCLKAEARGLKEEACRNLEQERAKFGAEISQFKKQKEDLDSSQTPIIERIEADKLVLEQDNEKLLEQCKYLASGIKDGQELLRTRDLQLARAEFEKTKIEVDAAAKVKRLEADKSECEQNLKRLQIEASTLRSHSQECESAMRRLKSELEGANCSASERESHLKGQEATFKMEAAKERASLTGQLEAANKQIKTLKTEVSKKALVAEEARLGLDNLRQERQEAVERINIESTKQLADMQERVSELLAKNKSLHIQLSEALEDAERTRTRQVHHSRQEGEIKRCEFESAMQKIRSLEAQNAHLIDSEQAKLAELKYFRSKDQLAPAEDDQNHRRGHDVLVQTDSYCSDDDGLQKYEKLKMEYDSLLAKQQEFAFLISKRITSK